MALVCLLDQVFDHPHPHAARLVIHLVAEFVDKQPDHVQTNGFIVELRLVASAEHHLLLHRPRRYAPHLDLEAPRPALEGQLQLSVATPPLLGRGGAGTFARLGDGDVQVVDFLDREADDETQGGGGPVGDDAVVSDRRQLQLGEVGSCAWRLVASGRWLVANPVYPHASSRCWPAADLRRRPSPPRASRTRSRHPVIAAPVAFIARSAALNLSLTPLTMSSICCRLWRSSGSASRASSSVRVRMASIVRKLRVMLRRMKDAKMLSRRKPMPTSSTPTCHTITNSSRAPHSQDIVQVLPHSGGCQTWPESRLRWLGAPHPAGGRPPHDNQHHQIVDRVQLAQGEPGAYAGDPQCLSDEDGQRAEPEADQVVRRPRRHHVGELGA